MNRIAARAYIVLFLVLALAAGTVFFLGEYIVNADHWVLSAGSPHVYSGERIGTGTITDRSGQLLVDLTDGRSYADSEQLRRSMLHWTGDTQGNIRAPYVDYYADVLLGYDFASGVYTYGDAQGSVRLTLSAQAQMAALEAMGSYVGTVAVYNYRTGELLCAVTTPTFDPENVPDIAGDTSGAYTGVYMNRFLQSRYIPGSIFKIATLAAALETVPDIRYRTFTCTGSYDINGGDITCLSAHGEQTLKEAFSNSCNCAFAQITQIIGSKDLARYISLFGLTDPVRFDGLTTVSGNFSVEGATGEEVAWSGIGQHKDQINPCAYLAFVGAVASDGIGVQPYVVAEVTAGDATTYTASAQQGQRIMSRSTAKVLREYMANNVAVKYGRENFPDVTVCAKSGTGEVGGGKQPNAMFTGFIDDPDYPLAFIVAIEEGGFGAQTCIPVLTPVLEACMSVLDSED